MRRVTWMGVCLALAAVSLHAQEHTRLRPIASTENHHLSVAATAASPGLQFYALTPCRAYDTPFSGAVVFDMVIRGFCGVPAEATAVMYTVAAVQPLAPGNLLFWQWGQPKPLAATLNFSPLVVSSSAGVVWLCDLDGPVLCEFGEFHGQSSQTITRLIIDITGYYAE